MINKEDLEKYIEFKKFITPNESMSSHYYLKDSKEFIVTVTDQWTFRTLNIHESDIQRWQNDPKINKNIVASHNKVCYHEYVTYVGFSETYKFCTKCDQKENNK